MRVIDCDAHVEECVESWQYLDPEFYLLRPIPVTFPEDTCFGWHNAAWVIDYKLRFFASNPTLMKRSQDKGTPIPVQEMRGAKQRAKVDRWLAERVFVACALDDDLPYVTSKLGDAFIVTATDFPHGDAFRQDQLAQGLIKRGDLSAPTIENILSKNPQRLYHF